MTTESEQTKKWQPSTKDIRKSLAFEDEAVWKKFTTRRLQLIGTFNLGEEKASKQNQGIGRVADILRTEFNYPLAALPHFEKLVVAAVQSIRRNKKRSIKRQDARSSDHGSDKGVKKPVQPSKSKAHLGEVVVEPIKTITRLPSFKHIKTEAQSAVVQPIVVPTTTHASTPLPPIQHTSLLLHKIPEQSQIRQVLSDIINSVIPLLEQQKGTWHAEPDLSGFLTGRHRDVESILPVETKGEIPFSLKEKLLQNLEKSKTCAEIVNSPKSLEDFSVLTTLGKSAYNTSLAFVLEKFTASQQNSLNILTDATALMVFASDVCESLFKSATKIDVSTALSQTGRTTLLFLAIGSLIKDFGFDPILYPLCELVMQLIMLQYPTKESCKTLGVVNKQLSHNSNNALLLALPINPQLANKELYRNVMIKYGTKEQNFRFPLLSNGPPTMSEIMKNSRALFAISDLNRIPLGLYHENNLITTDENLASLFKDISSKTLNLVIHPIEKHS